MRNETACRSPLTPPAAAAAGSLFGYPYIALMPVLARKLFIDDAAGNGFLIGSIGAGALVATGVALWIGAERLRRRD